MKEYKIDNFNIINSVFYPIDTNMFVITEDDSALVFDPHVSQDVFHFLRRNAIKDITIILTHEHPDHTSGVHWLTENFSVTLICQENCAKIIAEEKNNRPILISFVLAELDKINGTEEAKKIDEWFKPYECHADITFKDNLAYTWRNYKLQLVFTPGHSRGSCCILLDEKFIITGDSCLKDYPVITRFPGGSKKDYCNITIPFLSDLDSNLNVLPGHGNVFKLRELKERGKDFI